MQKQFPYFLYLAIITLISTSCGDDSEPIQNQFTHKVVVEKFTGEWCAACANAGSFFKKNLDNEQFIGVAIHAGGSSQADRYKNNEACKTMNSHLRSHLRDGSGSVGFPNVMFDRSENEEGDIINGYLSFEWDDAMSRRASRTATCGLKIESKIEGDILSGSVKYVLTEELVSSPAITVYLVENDLDGSLQVNGGVDYTHSAVLRELMTSRSGTSID